MKSPLYALLTAAGLLLCSPNLADAASSRLRLTEKPADTQRKTTAHEKAGAENKAVMMKKATSRHSNKMSRLSYSVLMLLGLETSKHVTSPLKRDLQLHRYQRQLRIKARQESRAHRARCLRQMK